MLLFSFRNRDENHSSRVSLFAATLRFVLRNNCDNQTDQLEAHTSTDLISTRFPGCVYLKVNMKQLLHAPYLHNVTYYQVIQYIKGEGVIHFDQFLTDWIMKMVSANYESPETR